MEDQSVHSMNKIASMVNEKNTILWKNEAHIKFYETKCNETEKEIEKIIEEIKSVNSDIERTKPEIEQLEYCFNSQTEAIMINHQSLINQELYLKNLEEKSAELREKYGQILHEIEEKAKQYEETLKNSNDLYKVLVEKQIRLKKCEINCLEMQQRSKDLRDMHKKQREIKEKIFYNDIVKFAEWVSNENRLKQRQCNEKLEQQSKMKEREALKQSLKVEEKTANHLHKPMTELSKANKTESPITVNILDIFNKVNTSEQNFSSNTYKLPDPQKKFNNDMSKIRILDVQTIVAPSSKEKSPVRQSLSQRFKKFISQLTESQNTPQSQSDSTKDKNISQTVKSQDNCEEVREQQMDPSTDNINIISQKSVESTVIQEKEKENRATEVIQTNQSATINENKRTFNFYQEKKPENNVPISSLEFKQVKDTYKTNFNFLNSKFSSASKQNGATNEKFQLSNSFQVNNQPMDMNFAASVEDSSMYLPINLSPSEDMFSTEGYAAFMKSPEYIMEDGENVPLFQMETQTTDNEGFGGFSNGFKLF